MKMNEVEDSSQLIPNMSWTVLFSSLAKGDCGPSSNKSWTTEVFLEGKSSGLTLKTERSAPRGAPRPKGTPFVVCKMPGWDSRVRVIHRTHHTWSLAAH